MQQEKLQNQHQKVSKMVEISIFGFFGLVAVLGKNKEKSAGADKQMEDDKENMQTACDADMSELSPDLTKDNQVTMPSLKPTAKIPNNMTVSQENQG